MDVYAHSEAVIEIVMFRYEVHHYVTWTAEIVPYTATETMVLFTNLNSFSTINVRRFVPQDSVL